MFIGPNVSKLKLDERVDLSRLKVYYMYEINDPSLTRVSPQNIKVIDSCVKHLQSLGASVQQIYFSEFEEALLLWMSALRVDGLTPIAQELTNRKGAISPFLELIKSIYGGSQHTFDAIIFSYLDACPPTQEVVEKFRKIGENLRTKIHKLLGNEGIMLFTTYPVNNVKLNAGIFNIKNNSYTGVLTPLQVAITQVPMGLNTKGLPLGLQVIAKAFNDHLTIAVAEEFERKFGGWVSPTIITAK